MHAREFQSELSRPPHRFVDEQIRGPYRQWIYGRTFELRDGGALARDVVQCARPFDFLVHRLMVRSDFAKMFALEARELRKRFARTA